MNQRNDPNKEGHTREWQDRARVVLDAKDAAETEASPKQSPVNTDNIGEGKENDTRPRSEDAEDSPVY